MDFKFLSTQPTLALDLGTSKVLIFKKNRGILVREPTLLLIDTITNQVIGHGQEAVALKEKRVDDVVILSSFSDGLIANGWCLRQLFTYWKKTLSFSLLDECIPPRAIIPVPLHQDQVHAQGLHSALIASGLSPIYIPAVCAISISQGHDALDPIARIIIDAGGGKIDIGILSGGKILARRTLYGGGLLLDHTIVRFIRSQHKVVISSTDAMSLKHAWDGFYNMKKSVFPVIGKNVLNGKLETVVVTYKEMETIIMEFCSNIIQGINEIISVMPTGVIRDISSTGILMGGGLSQIVNIDILLSRSVHLPVVIAKQPATAPVLGCSSLFHRPQLLQQLQLSIRN